MRLVVVASFHRRSAIFCRVGLTGTRAPMKAAEREVESLRAWVAGGAKCPPMRMHAAIGAMPRCGIPAMPGHWSAALEERLSTVVS